MNFGGACQLFLLVGRVDCGWECLLPQSRSRPTRSLEPRRSMVYCKLRPPGPMSLGKLTRDMEIRGCSLNSMTRREPTKISAVRVVELPHRPYPCASSSLRLEAAEAADAVDVARPAASGPGAVRLFAGPACVVPNPAAARVHRASSVHAAAFCLHAFEAERLDDRSASPAAFPFDDSQV